MAVYKTDFSGDDLGLPPSDWTTYEEQTTDPVPNNLFNVRADSNATGGKVASFNYDDVSSGNHYRKFIWNTVPNDTQNFRAKMRWRSTESSGGSDMRFLVRTDDTPDPTGYMLGVREDDLDINEWVDGNFDNHANDTNGYDAEYGVWYITECEVTGNNLRVRSWEEGTTAPSTWVEDTDDTLTSGGFGLVAYGDEAVDIDWMTVTTAGEEPTAPTEIVSSADTTIVPGQTQSIQISIGSNVTPEAVYLVNGTVRVEQQDFSWDSSSAEITYTCSALNMPYKDGYDLEVNFLSQEPEFIENVTLSPGVGYATTTAEGTLVISGVESAVAPYDGPDPVEGDQIKYPIESELGGAVTINPDLTWQIDYTALGEVPAGTDSIDLEFLSDDGSGEKAWTSYTMSVYSVYKIVKTLVSNAYSGEVPPTLDVSYAIVDIEAQETAKTGELTIVAGEFDLETEDLSAGKEYLVIIWNNAFTRTATFIHSS